MSVRVSYKGTELGKGGVLTFKQIYSKIFGPTYPGWFDRNTSRYILSYPGVAFSFLVPDALSSDGIIKYLSGTSSNNSKDGRGACLSMAIFKGHSWPEAQGEIFKPRSIDVQGGGGDGHNDGNDGNDRNGNGNGNDSGNGNANANDNVVSSSPLSSTSSDNTSLTVQIDHLQIHHSQGKCLVIFSHHPLGLNEYEIRLNSTTMQNVIMTLGPPSERIFKQDSRLSIHNPEGNADMTDEDILLKNHPTGTGNNGHHGNSHNSSSNSSANNPRNKRKYSATALSKGNTDLFFNYFELGFDLCFDTSLPDPFVKKIIVHGNVPSSLSFQVYNRCRWLLYPADYSRPPINSETPFSKSYNLFISKDDNDNNPPLSMMLNRTIESPSSSVELVGDEEQTLSAADEDDWGSTQLYGCPRCIFEVLKNDTISSLTIF